MVHTLASAHLTPRMFRLQPPSSNMPCNARTAPYDAVCRRASHARASGSSLRPGENRCLRGSEYICMQASSYILCSFIIFHITHTHPHAIYPRAREQYLLGLQASKRHWKDMRRTLNYTHIWQMLYDARTATSPRLTPPNAKVRMHRKRHNTALDVCFQIGEHRVVVVVDVCACGYRAGRAQVVRYYAWCASMFMTCERIWVRIIKAAARAAVFRECAGFLWA